MSFADRATLWLDLITWRERVINYNTAIFLQINLGKLWAHHDALEFPDGQIVLLTMLKIGQQATVLQLPAASGGAKAPVVELAAFS